MIFDDSGCPVYAVTGGSNINPHYFKEQFILPEKIKKSGKVDLWIELAGNALFGLRQTEDPALKEKNPDGTFTGLVKAMSLALFNTEAWKLWLDFCTIFEVFKTFPKEDYRSRRLLDAMNRAINAYDENPENAAAAREILVPVLHTRTLFQTAGETGSSGCDRRAYASLARLLFRSGRNQGMDGGLRKESV